MSRDNFKFLEAKASKVAPILLGCIIERQIDGHKISARIVETEAYDQSDIASHSYNGQTPRTSVMFGPAGYLYVYFTYGMHYCCNIVVGKPGEGAAVLIRALEPLSGEAVITKNRKGQNGLNLTNGPAKLCQALLIDKSLNGHNLSRPPLKLIKAKRLKGEEIAVSTRIGISRAKDTPWRFFISENPWVSKP